MTMLGALIAALLLLDTGLVAWMNRQNDIPFGLPDWARAGLLIPLLAAVGTALTAWQNGGQFVPAVLVGLLGVGPGIVLVLLDRLSAWFKSRKALGPGPVVSLTRALIDEAGRPQARTMVLGVGPVTLASGTDQQIRISPHRPFKFRRLVIPPSVADGFMVRSLANGIDPMFVSSDPVPALAFVPDAAPIDFGGPVCMVGSEFVLSIRNSDTRQGIQPRVFCAFIEGVSIS
jgi:hypothetical protein